AREAPPAPRRPRLSGGSRARAGRWRPHRPGRRSRRAGRDPRGSQLLLAPRPDAGVPGARPLEGGPRLCLRGLPALLDLLDLALLVDTAGGAAAHQQRVGEAALARPHEGHVLSARADEIRAQDPRALTTDGEEDAHERARREDPARARAEAADQDPDRGG